MSFQKRALSLVWTLGITACVGVDGGEGTGAGDGDLSGMGAGDSVGATGGNGVVTTGGTGGDLNGGLTGGASTGGAEAGVGGAMTGGSAATGGDAGFTGGASTGGAASGGAASGGAASGGAASGGAASGGAASGGAASGGAASGGSGGDECDYPTWAYGTDYYVGDIVWYDGSLYIVENDNPGYDPTISTWFWDPYEGDCDGGSGGSSSGGSGSGGSGSGGSGSGGSNGDPCSAGNLVWKSGKKTNYTSYPDPGSEECIVYNGCEWAGQFAACNGVKSEAWVEAHNIVALFPGFDDYALHDICIKSGDKTMVVTVYDTCGDSDCNGCCTNNKGSADALIDLESYTNARWGLPDGTLQWADLGPTTGGGCD